MAKTPRRHWLPKPPRLSRRSLFQHSLLDVLNQRATFAAAKTATGDDAEKLQVAITTEKKKLDELEKLLVEAAVDSVTVDGEFTAVGTSYPSTTTGRRTALADWITHPNNPLTARVAINQIWMRYFGEPLVGTPDDFGLRSSRPIHQELLDWLSVELMENNWSMKHIHRLILNSNTYRIASSSSSISGDAVAEVERSENFIKNSAIDPDNQNFWRANVRRLSAEQVRDNLLAVAGTLDPTRGGPDIDFRDGEKTLRRSLYFRHAYEKQMPMLVVFDAANPTDCYRRSESIIPQQALALANSPLAIDQARHTSKRLGKQSGDDRSFIRHAYVAILSRQPTADEMSACENFLTRQAKLLSSPESLSSAGGTAKTTVQPSDDAGDRARENMVHALLNTNDFVTVR